MRHLTNRPYIGLFTASKSDGVATLHRSCSALDIGPVVAEALGDRDAISEPYLVGRLTVEDDEVGHNTTVTENKSSFQQESDKRAIS